MRFLFSFVLVLLIAKVVWARGDPSTVAGQVAQLERKVVAVEQDARSFWAVSWPLAVKYEDWHRRNAQVDHEVKELRDQVDSIRLWIAGAVGVFAVLQFILALVGGRLVSSLRVDTTAKEGEIQALARHLKESDEERKRESRELHDTLRRVAERGPPLPPANPPPPPPGA
jgi:signal transduction histidine kinase